MFGFTDIGPENRARLSFGFPDNGFGDHSEVSTFGFPDTGKRSRQGGSGFPSLGENLGMNGPGVTSTANRISLRKYKAV